MLETEAGKIQDSMPWPLATDRSFFVQLVPSSPTR